VAAAVLRRRGTRPAPLRLGAAANPPSIPARPPRLDPRAAQHRRPSEIAYYVCFGKRGTRLRELVRVAGSRWAVEESFQTAKNEVGLDQYQVRRYDAWYAHITLAMLAAAFLVATRASEAATGAPAVPNPR
jgi:SRSO17 transposase